MSDQLTVTVVVATDLGPSASSLVEDAHRLALQCHADLLVVHVFHPTVMVTPVFPQVNLNAQLIVVGHVPGSVAEAIARTSPCSLMVQLERDRAESAHHRASMTGGRHARS